MQRKAFVLFSGGLDSTTCLYKAIFDLKPIDMGEQHIFDLINQSETVLGLKSGEIYWVEAISVDYGQRHIKETEYAAATCKRLGIKHTILNLQGLLGKVMLTDKNVAIPNITYDQIKGVSPTYVPFRNGTMLSLITAQAQNWINENPGEREAFVYFGAHAEDAMNWAYPDCTPEFIGAMANAIYIGSYNKIRLVAPLMNMLKADIVALGENCGVPFEKTWSCYRGLEMHCGECPTCYSRHDAFVATGIEDPTTYANDPERRVEDVPF